MCINLFPWGKKSIMYGNFNWWLIFVLHLSEDTDHLFIYFESPSQWRESHRITVITQTNPGGLQKSSASTMSTSSAPFSLTRVPSFQVMNSDDWECGFQITVSHEQHCTSWEIVCTKWIRQPSVTAICFPLILIFLSTINHAEKHLAVIFGKLRFSFKGVTWEFGGN